MFEVGLISELDLTEIAQHPTGLAGSKRFRGQTLITQQMDKHSGISLIRPYTNEAEESVLYSEVSSLQSIMKYYLGWEGCFV